MTKRLLILLASIVGALIPAVVFAASIDATDYQSRLCSNGDCSVYSTVYWRTTNGTPVTVTDTGLSGYIWSENFGWINLAPSQGGITNSTGTLSGYAWGSETGWVNFGPTHGGVTIDPSTGEFSGSAWVSGAGWMIFNCSLGTSACVKTDWRPNSGGGSHGHGGGGGGGGGCVTNCGTTGGGGGSGGGGGTGGCVTDCGTTGGGGGTTGGGGSGDGGGGTTTGGGGSGGGGTTGGGGGGTTGGGGDTGGGGSGGSGDGGGTTIVGGGTHTGGGCPVVTNGTIFEIIKGEVETSYCQTKLTVTDAAHKIRDLFNSKKGSLAAKTVGALGIVMGTSATIASALFLNPVSFSELFLIPMRLWSLLMTTLGLKKRRRPWGTVYDSVTKQPLDPAFVTLRSAEGVDVASTLTDLDGRFGFIVPAPGAYTLVAQKTNYMFPSQHLVGHDHDELYRDLYFGEHFTVAAAGEVVIRNIPMDPEKFDWNEFAKKEQHLMKFYSRRTKWLFLAADILFWIGFVVASVAVLAAPITYNVAVFVLYCVIFFLKHHGLKARPFGYVEDKLTGKPISFGVIRVSYATTGVEVIHRITDEHGKYYCLLPNGEYVVRIDRKFPDETYQTMAQGIPVKVENGYLAKTFSV